MRLNFSFISTMLLIIVLILSACKCNDCDYDYLTYQIENKLASPIQVRFVSKSYPTKNVDVLISVNEIKDVINGESGLYGFGLVSYDSAFITVNSTEYRYIRNQSNSLLSSSLYLHNGSSKKNGKTLNTYKLIVDEDFLLKSSK